MKIDDPACFSDLFCLSGKIWCSASFTIEFEIDGRNKHRMFKTVKCMKILNQYACESGTYCWCSLPIVTFVSIRHIDTFLSFDIVFIISSLFRRPIGAPSKLKTRNGGTTIVLNDLLEITFCRYIFPMIYN